MQKQEELDAQKHHYENKIREMESRINSMETDNQDAAKFKAEKHEMEAIQAALQADLEKAKKERMAEVNEKVLEKIQATEKLRKEMLFKIKETKANLLALNDEQLQTTTTLTIL